MLDNLDHFLTAHCLVFLDCGQLDYYYYYYNYSYCSYYYAIYFEALSVKLLSGCSEIVSSK